MYLTYVEYNNRDFTSRCNQKSKRKQYLGVFFYFHSAIALPVSLRYLVAISKRDHVD